MKIKAVSALRGELVLGSIGKSLRADQELTISEESYYKDDIQLMLKSGRIFISEGNEAIPTGSTLKEEAKVSVVSMHTKPLVIASLPFTLQPNLSYGLTLRQYKTDEVQQALTCGLIAPADPEAAAAAKKALIDAKLAEQAEDAKDDEDAAERFYRTREAQTISRPVNKTPKDSYVYDPHNTLAEKVVPPKGSYAYDPHGNQMRQPSPNLPIRGQIKPANQINYDEELPPTQSSRQQPAASPKRAGVGGRKIRPIGNGGGDLGGDDVEMEIL